MRCYRRWWHFQRNVLSREPQAAQGYVAAAIQTIFAQSPSELAKQALHKAV